MCFGQNDLLALKPGFCQVHARFAFGDGSLSRNHRLISGSGCQLSGDQLARSYDLDGVDTPDEAMVELTAGALNRLLDRLDSLCGAAPVFALGLLLVGW